MYSCKGTVSEWFNLERKKVFNKMHSFIASWETANLLSLIKSAMKIVEWDCIVGKVVCIINLRILEVINGGFGL